MKKIACLFMAICGLSFGYHHHHKKHRHHRGLVRMSSKFLHNAKRAKFAKKDVVFPPAYRLNVSPAMDQGQCGGCWAFSLTETLRDTFLTQLMPDPGELSPQYLLNCATNSYGCDGGDFDSASFMIKPQGPPTTAALPYQAANGTCDSYPVAASAVSFQIVGGVGGPTFKDIAYVLAFLHRPLSTEVDAEDSFQEYDDGIYDACDGDMPNHMVQIAGYDCEGKCNFDANGNLPAGQGYYVVKNSWATSWGENGFIRMKATRPDGSRCSMIGAAALYYNLK